MASRSRKSEPLRPIVEQAWKDAPIGESVFLEKRISKFPHMVVVSPHFQSNRGYHDKHIIAAYPQLEHIEKFDAARKIVQDGGPSEDAPGAIGSAKLREDPVQKIFSLLYIQAHFKTSKTDISPINRALASKYGGWRVRVLEEAIKTAHSKDFSFRLSKSLPAMRRLIKPHEEGESQFVKDLKKACENLGVKLDSTSLYYGVKPPKK